MAIYHSIIMPKGGPLNVWQSNLALGTVHWVPCHSPTICLALFTFPSLCYRAGRTKLALFVAFQSCVIYSWVRTSHGHWPWQFTEQKWKGKCWVDLKCSRGLSGIWHGGCCRSHTIATANITPQAHVELKKHIVTNVHYLLHREIIRVYTYFIISSQGFYFIVSLVESLFQMRVEIAERLTFF